MATRSRLSQNDLAVGGRLVSIVTPFGTHDEVLLALHGAHQASNAACAVAAAEAFSGSRLDDDAVTTAFAAVSVPGRLEVMSVRPLIVLDGAHNPAGAEVLAESLEEEFRVAGATRCVVGMLTGRDPVAVLEPLAALGTLTAYCCQAVSPRALDAVDVAAAALTLGFDAVVVPDVADAVDAAVADASEDDLIVITGSFYVVGAARGHLLGFPPHRG